MGRLSLIIADNDVEYLTKFEKFLLVNHPQRFDVFSFSSFCLLSDFLCSADKSDILLVDSKMYKKELNFQNIEVVMFLSDDGMELIPEGFETIAKYQHAERLVMEILRLYADKSLKTCMMYGNADTRVVCVYSPIGGVGKTSIAAGCSILCARKGMKAFYLNLEEVPSTNLFFCSETEQSFSNVIYHLKGKGSNLGLKLEGAKCCDLQTGVHFFTPPDSIFEMEELSNHDVVRLVNVLKASAAYDTVFIDMSCGLNQRNTALLGCVDIILLVLAPDDTSTVKTKQLKAGFDMLKHKYGIELAGRVITILNKSGNRESSIDKTAFIGSGQVVEIGECKSQAAYGHTAGLVEDAAFLSGLNRLLENVMPRGTAEENEYVRGEFIV